MQSNPTEFPTVMSSVRATYNEGVLAFYKGSLVPLLLTSARNATLWGCYSSFYQNIYKVSRPEDLSLFQVFFSGCAAGFGNAFVEGPADLLKSKVQMQRGKANAKYTGSLDCARKIIKQHGFFGLYQAQHAVWFRNIPANGLYMLCFQFLKRKDAERNGRSIYDPISPYKSFLFGGASGTLYWIGAFPMDVVKSNLQTDDSDPNKRKYKSYIDCIQKLYQQNGFRAFTRGFLPCIMRSFPANGACFVCIEMTSRLIRKYMD